MDVERPGCTILSVIEGLHQFGVGAGHVGVDGIKVKKFKLTTFSVRMLLINRWFDPSLSKRDLGYEPIVEPEEAWRRTVTWFKKEWMPKHGPQPEFQSF